MLCEKCKQKEATVSIREVKNKEKVCVHLCEDCAQIHSQYIEEPSFTYAIHSLLGNFLEAIVSKAKEENVSLKCEKCGITYNEFRKEGRFGCANDYHIFSETLLKLFSHIHGANRHIGKMPKGFQEKQQYQKKLKRLEKMLQKAVQDERYEEAAKIRDEIKTLEGI